jgi:hypothetical protein
MLTKAHTVSRRALCLPCCPSPPPPHSPPTHILSRRLDPRTLPAPAVPLWHACLFGHTDVAKRCGWCLDCVC